MQNIRTLRAEFHGRRAVKASDRSEIAGGGTVSAVPLLLQANQDDNSSPHSMATSLFAPTTAVVRTSERQFVVRVRNGVAEWVNVRRGELNGDVIEVFGELRAGDDVVRRGNDEIRPGTKITPSAGKS